MVEFIRIDTRQLDVLMGNFKNLSPNMQKSCREGMREWGNILVRDLKDSAKINGKLKDFTGDLQGKGIRWEQSRTGNIGKLLMPQYALDVDSMEDHWVNVKSSRGVLLKWALQARSEKIQRRARLVAEGRLDRFGVFVHQHPFIQSGLNKSIPKLNVIISRQVNTAIKNTIRK